MDLPKSIVKEFAKQAVEKKPTVDKPTQLVGTVQVEDGQTFVYLDGSNGSKTPVSETVVYQSGDRVLVSIQNRKATIIGNYTGPSINQALDNVMVEYALSSSSVSFIAWPGEKGEWNTIAPEKEDGSYMWQRTTKISTNPLINPEISLTCIQGSDGKNGYTPYIGSNGNWWINGVDTGYSAEGDDGHSPYVDTTTNTWWEWDADIGGYHDTGIVPQGPGVFKSIVFKRFSSQPSTPTEGSYLSPVPSGWSDGIPSGTEQIWISTRVFTSDGKSPQTSEWTTPQMVSDTPDIDFEYSWIVTNPGNPTDNPGNWSNEATENSIWMAVRKKSIGTWSSWEINKIKGETGAEGYSPTVTTGTSSDGSTTVTVTNKDGSTTTELVDGTARVDIDTLSDKTRSGFIEMLSGTGFVQSNKTEDGGTLEVVMYGKSVQDGTPTPDAPVEIQSVESPKVTACGKNLSDILDFNTSSSSPWANQLKPIKDIPPGTYTISCDCVNNISKSRTAAISIREYGNPSVFYGETFLTIDTSGYMSATFTIPEGSTGIYIYFYSNSTGTALESNTDFINIQIEKGENATDYEPYKAKTATLSDIELRSAGKAKDRVFKDSDGLWKVEKNTGEVDLGTLNWMYESVGTRFYSNTIDNLVKANSGNGVMSNCTCSKLVTGTPDETFNTKDNIVAINSLSVSKVIARATSFSADASAFTAAMLGTILYYELATPTYEVLPDSIQAELNALTTYNPITNVIASDGVTPDIDVSFLTRDYRTKNIAESIVKRVVIDDDSVDIVDSTGRLLASYGDKTEIYDASGKAQVSLGATKSTISGFDIVPLEGGHDYFKSDWEASDGNFYRTWIRSADNTDLGQTWGLSTQMKNQNDGKLYGGFIAKSNGDTHIMPMDSVGAVAGANVLVTKDNGITMYPNKTVSKQPNIYWVPSGTTDLHRVCYTTWSASSEQIKDEIKSIENAELNPQNLYDVDVVQFKYKPDFLEWDDERYGKELIGFVIENLNEKYPIAVDKADEYDPKTWNWNSAYMIPAMLKLIQEQHKEIEELKELMKGSK